MTNRKSIRRTLAALACLVPLAAVACGGGDGEAGLSRPEVAEVVRAELAAVPAPSQPVAGITAAEAEQAIEAALAALPQPDTGLSRAEVEEVIEAALAAAEGSGLTAEEAERIARGAVASIPPRSAPAEYTKFFVDSAISRYETLGLDATVAYYNRPESIDGQWYVFIVDENDQVIGHYDPDRRGLDVKGWVGTDANGYRFGPEMLAATEAGRWVPYVYVNPAGGTLGDEGAFELKNAWVVRHDGLLFASGWYINTDEFVPQLISESAEHFRTGGLEAILEFYNDPQGISTGLIPTVEYYNSTDTLDGYFTGFIAAPDGEILTHFDPALIGTDVEDLLGPAVRNATADGAWITAEDNPATAAGPETMRMWVIDVDGTLIGGGWYNDGNG